MIEQKNPKKMQTMFTKKKRVKLQAHSNLRSPKRNGAFWPSTRELLSPKSLHLCVSSHPSSLVWIPSSQSIPAPSPLFRKSFPVSFTINPPSCLFSPSHTQITVCNYFTCLIFFHLPARTKTQLGVRFLYVVSTLIH